MAAYYNENDPFAAAWLRELIKAGHVADGVVDDRSIADVRAQDLEGFSQCHFFAGIGVWSHALKVAGWRDDRAIWTGSCPCQPFSAAGRGGGAADERHLWPEFYRLIGECRPAITIGEQVASKAGRAWFSTVRADLEGSGYSVAAADLPACGVGAPHIRQRLWWVGKRLGDAADGGREPRPGLAGVPAGEARLDALPQPRAGRGDDRLADAARQRLDGSGDAGAGWRQQYPDDGAVGGLADASNDGWRAQRQRHNSGHVGNVADADGEDDGRLADAGHRTGRDGSELPGAGRADEGPPPDQERHGVERAAAHRGPDGGLADADDGQRRGLAELRGPERDRTDAGRAQGDGEPEPSGDNGRLANADGGDASAEGLQRGRQLGQCQENDGVGGSGDRGIGDNAGPGMVWPDAADGFWRDADWLLCRDGKWRPVEAGTFPLVTRSSDGVGYVCADCCEVHQEITNDKDLRTVREIPVEIARRVPAEILQQGMSVGGVHEDTNNAGSRTLSGAAFIRSDCLSGLRSGGAEIAPASSGREPDEQRPDEHSDPVQGLPREGARPPACLICGGTDDLIEFTFAGDSRVGRLRGYGNALCAPVAQVFVETLMEIL